MQNGIVDWLLKRVNFLLKYVLDSQTKSIEQMVHQKVDKLNKLVASESKFTFDFELVKGVALNLTMTKAPSILAQKQELVLNFDGRFNPVDQQGSHN